ncbi:hypothetical protein H4O18_20780 [Arenibacter sp. BSSL-BM3]|uniref:Uncharacterized protein n=1 Tax=Arenibacter arenosicollis TaxID=2762274 RepID=A0ABR7QTC7_9FLAO|nr:hypothetical protein [Arenibacter arenosicollis]MBC8770442.1 hypothetical protein [Arenibacter arenosicollis]
MDANVVYSIAKALPKKEQLALLNMLQKDIHLAQSPNSRRKKAQNFTDEQAIEYLLQTVFNSKK